MTINTTPPVSTASAVIAYLVAAIPASYASDPNANAILLTLADPGDGPNLPPEIINIGAVRRTLKVETFIGGGGVDWLDESYTIDCIVSAFTGSSDTDGATTIQLQQVQRVWQLLGYIEVAIRDDPSLGGLVNIAYPKSSMQDQPQWTERPDGLLVEISFQIYCECLN